MHQEWEKPFLIVFLWNRYANNIIKMGQPIYILLETVYFWVGLVDITYRILNKVSSKIQFWCKIYFSEFTCYKLPCKAQRLNWFLWQIKLWHIKAVSGIFFTSSKTISWIANGIFFSTIWAKETSKVCLASCVVTPRPCIWQSCWSHISFRVKSSCFAWCGVFLFALVPHE